jgi:hypothetical protein
MLASTACGSGTTDTAATADTVDAAATLGTSSTAAASTEPASTDSTAIDTAPGTEPSGTVRCVVRLHGKGGTGGETSATGGITEVLPTGNADGWGARQWLYFPDESYAEARDIVTAAAADAGCTRLVLDGFSNGAAFAAKLYCRGETFDGRLVGVVIDDPVPDGGVASCTPPADVAAALYWTGGLEPQAQSGADCATIDWTCDGGTMIGIEAYAESLGLDIEASPHTEHEWYLDAPEIATWLAD